MQKQTKNTIIMNYKNLDELNDKFFTRKPMKLLDKYKRSKLRSPNTKEVVNSYVKRKIHDGSNKSFISRKPKFSN